MFEGGVRLTGEQLRTVLLIALFLATLALALLLLRPLLRRHARGEGPTGRGRSELERQRRDTLRSVRMMIQQMEYDAEVLGLLRHIRVCREKGREGELGAAIDELIRREREMMDRVDRAQELEDHLRQRYGRPSPFWRRAPGDSSPGGPGAGGGAGAPGEQRARGASPEELKADIRAFIGALERIRGGETRLLDEKIGYFERWVESPERQDLLSLLRAMELFLDRGDASALDSLSRKRLGR